MGKGKGAPEVWVAVIKPGRMIFEMEGVDAAGRARGVAAGGAQAVDADAVPRAARGHGGRRVVKLRELKRAEPRGAADREHELREELFRLRLSVRRRSWPTRWRCATHAARLARVKTMLHERTAATPMQGGGR